MLSRGRRGSCRTATGHAHTAADQQKQPGPESTRANTRADQAKLGELNVASPRRSARQVIAPGYEPPPIQPVAPRGRSYRTRYIFVIGVPLRWKSTLISDWSGLRMMNS